MITVASINTYNLYAADADEPRYRQLEALIRDLDADIVAVQEITAAGADQEQKRPGAVRGLRRLATAVDHICDIDGEPAVAVGGLIRHTGLLWRDGITPVPGSLHTLTREGGGMWHSAVSVVFDFAGRPLRVGSVQLSPFDLTWSTMDCAQLLRVFNSGATPGLLGGDFNCIGSDRAYDPDPYQGLSWHPDHAYQLTATGEVDRRPAHRLEASHLGRMSDCARLTGADWAATTGHHPADNHPARRIDRWYATHHFPTEAVTGYTVVDPDAVGDTTDHLPVVVTFDASAL
ncbi:endonuclease/exonuclease/phosphatase family protein [Actinoplanes flavus]|uniref:Endonuclease/exonuclease/phosphatase family protein n=1 Tax=Actinoplanes flavus TaxID=2820290 RepID=A0ABS3UD30_9ACTN|nr:endonuclease/exonuclease/phosphatase family protein [Actinoplanes flavus]MBO3736686.1 endonuclease/exonuclease/phosphatase family protein [Actinoplanes flavus]